MKGTHQNLRLHRIVGGQENTAMRLFKGIVVHQPREVLVKSRADRDADQETRDLVQQRCLLEAGSD